MLKKHWRFVNWTFSEQYMPKENNNGNILSVFSVILFIFLMILNNPASVSIVSGIRKPQIRF